MNTSRSWLPALLAASFLCASLARADETAYAKILKERDSVLVQIVAHRESQFATGTTDAEALMAARVALWSFRRDTALSNAGKIKQQELIVDLLQNKIANIKTRMTTGVATSEDLLLATDALLQAQQLLEELKLDGKKG